MTCPHTIGTPLLVDEHQVMDPIIPKHTKLPYRSKPFAYIPTTAYQKSLLFDVYSGEFSDPK